MAAANLSRPLFTCQLRGHGFLSRKRCRILSLRAFNGDSSISPEERAKKALKELDDQLSEVNQTSSPSSPRPLPGVESWDDPKRATSKGSLPELSDGFLLFLTGGLLMLTVVNNLLFYLFVELPSRKPQPTQQTMEERLESGKLSVDGSKAAPQPQAGSAM
eukprot:c16486_g1_i1 orf=52-534(-)